MLPSPQLSSSGLLHGEVILRGGVEEKCVGEGYSCVSPHNVSRNSSSLYVTYQSTFLTSITSLDERFLINSDSAVINTPSKIIAFGARKHAGYIGRQLFHEFSPGSTPPVGEAPPPLVPASAGPEPVTGAPMGPPKGTPLPPIILPSVRSPSYFFPIGLFLLGWCVCCVRMCVYGRTRVCICVRGCECVCVCE